jgi:hypothetical protein
MDGQVSCFVNLWGCCRWCPRCFIWDPQSIGMTTRTHRQFAREKPSVSMVLNKIESPTDLVLYNRIHVLSWRLVACELITPIPASVHIVTTLAYMDSQLKSIVRKVTTPRLSVSVLHHFVCTRLDLVSEASSDRLWGWTIP